LEYQTLAVLAAFAFLYSVVASGLERTPINGALVYLFAGLACGPYGLGLVELNVEAEGVKGLAEFTLALVLFSDAANSDLAVLRRVRRVPARLLLVGLPLTIFAGVAFGYLIFDELTLLEIALLATMLAPTDAALGQAVVTNESVPPPVRESLNVESGLNDGICVPVLLVFLALASGQVSSDETVALLERLPLQEIGFGAGVGILSSILGGYALNHAKDRGWISGVWVQIPIVALAMFCFGIAQWLGGSGFIACFVGGLVFGGLTKQHKEILLNGAEGSGKVFSLLTWFIFGAVVVGKGLETLSWEAAAYALLSLTVIRMLPVIVCLAGVEARFDTKLFVAWFGPRGLASIVFIVMVLQENLPGGETLAAVVVCTVALSIIAHGISAVPLARIYGQRVADRDGRV
jgi:NhaP-type Na+/H+ or K+/H+ antiporter